MVTYRYYVSPPHYWSTTGGSPPLAAMTARSLLGILRAKVMHRSLVTSGSVQCTTLSLNHRDLRPLSASIGGCHWHKFFDFSKKSNTTLRLPAPGLFVCLPGLLATHPAQYWGSTRFFLRRVMIVLWTPQSLETSAIDTPVLK